MELWIIWGIITVLSMLITTFTVGFGCGIAISISSGIFIVLWSWERDDEYDKWLDQECPGDRFYFEWLRCKYSRKNIMEEYDPNTYCKISLNDFQKYFAINPSRYQLHPSWATLENDDESAIIMVFPRRELFKYFKFRRHYLQSRKMVDVIDIVQKDIDKLKEEAQEQLDKARAALNTDFGNSQ